MANPYKLNPSSFSTHKLIARNIGSNKFVLDVGCNDGYLGGVSDRSNVFYGLDSSEKSTRTARSVYKDAIVYDLNNLKKLPWKNKFDVIIFADVLEHLIYPDKTLIYFVKNYLKTGGISIIALPNIANWQIRFNLFFGQFNYAETGILDKTHLHFYTFKTAKLLVDKAQMSIESEFGGSSVFGILIRFFPQLKGLLSTNIILKCIK